MLTFIANIGFINRFNKKILDIFYLIIIDRSVPYVTNLVRMRINIYIRLLKWTILDMHVYTYTHTKYPNGFEVYWRQKRDI